MDLENQKRVKEFAEEYGPENVVVIVGAADGWKNYDHGRPPAFYDPACG